MIAQCPLPPAKMKALPILAKNSWKTEIQAPRCAPPHTKTTASPKYPASHRSPGSPIAAAVSPHSGIKLNKPPWQCFLAMSVES